MRERCLDCLDRFLSTKELHVRSYITTIEAEVCILKTSLQFTLHRVAAQSDDIALFRKSILML